MAYIDNRINRLIIQLNKFSRQDFENAIINSDLNISKNSCSRILARLIKNQMIIRVKRNQYETVKENIKFDFNYGFSDFTSKISNEIFNEYPLVEVQVWELTLLNQFLNHLLNHNCIFVNVEADLIDTIFELLLLKGYRVLLGSDVKIFHRYSQDNVIVVSKLISQAPRNILDEKKISLERLLVDLVADKLLKSIVSQSEIPSVFRECILIYNLNRKTMLRYASRRGIKDEIEELLM